MIRSRNRARGGGINSIVLPSKTFDFTSLTSLPAEFTYTRADTVATYRNNAGNLTLASSNGLRVDYDINGNLLGPIIEDSFQNKCTNFNAVPDAGITNMVKGGDAAATLTRVADATALGVRKLQNVCTGNVWALDNTTGVADAYVDIGGTTGSVAAHSLSCEARLVSGTSGKILLNSGVGSVTFSNAAYAKIKSENITPSATTDQMRVLATAGSKVYFVLNQMEASQIASTPIVTSGAAVTRQADKLKDLNIATRPYFNTNEGVIIVEVDMQDINTRTHSFMYASDNNDNTSGDNNSVGIRCIGGRAKIDSAYVVYGPSGTRPMTNDLLSIDKAGEGSLNRQVYAIGWKNGQTVFQARSPAPYISAALGTFTKAFDRLYIGGQVFTSGLHGHIRKITMFNKYYTPAQIAPWLETQPFNFIFCLGQSNVSSLTSSQDGAANAGEQAAVARLDTYYPSIRNYVVDASTAGTSVLYYAGTSSGTNWWYNKDTGAIGVPFQKALDYAQVAKNTGQGTPLCYYWGPGESDAGIALKADFKNGIVQIKAKLDAIWGSSIPVVFKPLSRETSASNIAGYQTIREALREMETDYPGSYYYGPESFDLAQMDIIHLSNVSQGIYLPRIINKIAKVLGKTVTGGVNGSDFGTCTRSGATVTVTTAYESGSGDTDFTPTASIAGFHFFDGASEIAVTAAVRTNASTITLTLASVPANASQTLYYGYRSLYPEVATYTNLLKGNGTNALPFRMNIFSSSNTGASFARQF